MATLTTDVHKLFERTGVIEAHIEVTIPEERTNWSGRKALRTQWMPDTDSHGRTIMRPHWVEEVE